MQQQTIIQSNTINLKRKIFILLFVLGSTLYSLTYGVQVSAVSEDITYSLHQVEKEIKVNLLKKEKQFKVKNLEVVLGSFSYSNDYGSYRGKISNGAVISFTGSTLGYFPIADNLSITSCEDRFDMSSGKMSGGCKNIVEGNLTVHLPYFPNGKYADIYDPSGKKVLTIDLTSKATCNENDRCDQPIEDSENCPQDCKGNEPKLDPVVVEKASAAQNDSQKISSKSANWIIIAVFGIVLFIAGLGFWLWRRYKKYKSQI